MSQVPTQPQFLAILNDAARQSAALPELREGSRVEGGSVKGIHWYSQARWTVTDAAVTPIVRFFPEETSMAPVFEQSLIREAMRELQAEKVFDRVEESNREQLR